MGQSFTKIKKKMIRFYAVYFVKKQKSVKDINMWSKHFVAMNYSTKTPTPKKTSPRKKMGGGA